MPRGNRNLIFSFALMLVLLVSACAPISKVGAPDNASSNDPNSAAVTNDPTKTGTNDLPTDNFPRTPDPISIQVTLDKANEAESSSYGFPFYVKGKAADGSPFEIYLDNKLYNLDANGNLTSAFGTTVTMTPVATIEGLPFSGGFLTAIQLGPEGLLMAEPGKLTLSVPGNVENQNMIGFAANSDGSDFHLFPVTGSYSDYYKATQFSFDVMHFSFYGIAKATAEEVQAQTAHPPSSPSNQDEDELAPLLPIIYEDLTPLMSKLQLQLTKSHTRLVKPLVDNLSSTKCEQVTVAAYRFNEWRSKVDKAYQTDYFQSQINSDANALHDRFTACAKELCPICVSAQTNGKPDPLKIGSLISLATFAEDLSFQMGFDDFAWWRQLSSECALRGGIASPSGSTGGDYSGEGNAPTPVPFSCPL
jgi:hypothetical protein